MTDFLKLNFEGVDGATIWVDEAQGLSPDYEGIGMELDTSQYYFGSSSLLIPSKAETVPLITLNFTGVDDSTTIIDEVNSYVIENIGCKIQSNSLLVPYNDSYIQYQLASPIGDKYFAMRCLFKYNNSTDGQMCPLNTETHSQGDDNPQFMMTVKNDGIRIYLYDSNDVTICDNVFYDTIIPTNEFVELKYVCHKNHCRLYVGGVLLDKWKASEGATFTNIDKFWIGQWNSTPTDNMWIDQFEWYTVESSESNYTILNVETVSDFSYTMRFRYTGTPEEMYPIWLGTGNWTAEFVLFYWFDNWYIRIQDRLSNDIAYLPDHVLTVEPLPDTWVTYKIEVIGREISLYIDTILYHTWIATIDNSFLGSNWQWWFGNYNIEVGADMWIDQVEWSTPLTPSTFALQSTLQGISSNILLNGEEDFKNISVSFLLSLKDHEDIPVTVQWHGIRYRYIPTEFLVVEPGHYNYADVPLEFLLVSRDILEDIPIVFSIMRQTQTFTSYIMQKLYTVLTTLAGTITISDWNVRPNKTWFVKVVADAVTLYDTLADMTNGANPVAAGIADPTTFQVYLFYVDLSDVELYYEDFAYHLVLSSITSTGKFKVKPLTDMSELRHAIYNNSNIVLSKGEAELNLHTYVTIKRELVLGTHTPEIDIGDVVNFASARRGLIGDNTENSQVLSLSITGEISEDGTASLVDSIQIAKYMELYR